MARLELWLNLCVPQDKPPQFKQVLSGNKQWVLLEGKNSDYELSHVNKLQEILRYVSSIFHEINIIQYRLKRSLEKKQVFLQKQ